MRKQTCFMVIGLLLGGSAAAQTPVSQTPPATTEPAALTNHAAMPADALSEAAIKSRIADAGYKEVKGLEFEGGVWRTDARGGNDNWVELAVGPVTGKVYPEDAPSRLNVDEIKAKLAAAGYQNISGVEFDDGLWNAEADNAQGKEVNLLVDPDDGSVVAQNQD